MGSNTAELGRVEEVVAGAGTVTTTTKTTAGLAEMPTVATASLSGRKRQRDDAEDGGSSSAAGPQQPVVEVEQRRPSPTPVGHAEVQLLPFPQRLVDVCRYMFDGSTSTPPTAAVANLIRTIMDKIRPDDVGLEDELRFSQDMNSTGSPPIITYKTIFQCKNFEIAVIFLPQGTVMPLHDHPGMTVFSKVLSGSAHVDGYDWIRHPRFFSGPGSSKLAKKVLDHDVTEESGAWVLFPDAGGNMHRFVAGEGTHCAFINVLTPSYSPADQRHCTFYKDTPYKPCRCALRSGLMEAMGNDERPVAWLEEVPKPTDLQIASLPYRGPTIF